MKLSVTSFTNANAATLLEQGRTALQSGESTFDLSSVKEVDSAAVAALLAWRREAQSRGMTLKLTGVPPAVCSLATLYGVDRLLGTPHQESIVEHGHHAAQDAAAHHPAHPVHTSG